MRQILQSNQGAQVESVEVRVAKLICNNVMVPNVTSLISVETENCTLEFATEAYRQAKDRLDIPLPLGMRMWHRHGSGRRGDGFCRWRCSRLQRIRICESRQVCFRAAEYVHEMESGLIVEKESLLPTADCPSSTSRLLRRSLCTAMM